MELFTIITEALILSVIMIVALTFDIYARKIYNTALLSSIAFICLLMIYSNILNSTFILIPILIIAINGYLIAIGDKK